MRGYITNVVGDRYAPKIFVFGASINHSWKWDIRKQAENVVIFHGPGGFTVKSPDGSGRSASCIDFLVVQRPEGGFAISCEVPFLEELSGYSNPPNARDQLLN